MERCDFCSVMAIIREYISERYEINQVDLVYKLFESFMDDDDNVFFCFDNGLVCRWFKGLAKISPHITRYYLENRHLLSGDIEFNILPMLYDSAMAINEIHDLLVQDPTISDEIKRIFAKGYPCKDDCEKANYISVILIFAMERNFVKRDANTKRLLTSGSLSPIVREYVFNSEVPEPCIHFCGRKTEIKEIRRSLNKHGKLFVQGIPGIGKSEVAKAYAKQYRKDYTNAMYISYSGSLKNDIADLDFADDFDDTATIDDRFRKHNRFLRSLKEDTLIIIDNFNTVAIDEDVLSVVLQYRCHVLFTTRSRFDEYHSYTMEELPDESLLGLMGEYYSKSAEYQSILIEIIQTVHRHTFAVKLSARLLETGILEPQDLLDKFRKEKVGIDDDNTIGVMKDGKNAKATYYDHIHTLFALYKLSISETYVMRNLSLAPLSGMPSKLFATWLNLKNMNDINVLIEKGFVQLHTGRIIALHPMIQEVALKETEPSFTNCTPLVRSLEFICLCEGYDFPFNHQLIGMIMSVIKLIQKDDKENYMVFLQSVFSHLQRYVYIEEMRIVLSEMSNSLNDKALATERNRAILLDCQTALETDPQRMIELGEKAVSIISEITSDNAQLAANLYGNLSTHYKYSGNLEKAKSNIEKSIQIIQEYNCTWNHSIIVQFINFATLLSDTGENQRAYSMLLTLSKELQQRSMNNTMDQALIHMKLGAISLALGDVLQAHTHYKNAVTIYEAIYEDDPVKMEAIYLEIKEDFNKIGFSFQRQMIS